MRDTSVSLYFMEKSHPLSYHRSRRDIMKQLLTVLLVALMPLLSSFVLANDDYQSFESMELTTGMLLEDYSKADYKRYYKDVDKRRFFGWRINKVHDDIKVSYVTETLFSYYNDGYTPIEYTYDFVFEKTSKINVSATGSIALKQGKKDGAFANNLDAALKITASYDTSEKTKETVKIALDVDPGTQVNLYIYGEGTITNGVAARYAFWFRMARGGFEVFTVTTQYHRLEKVRI